MRTPCCFAYHHPAAIIKLCIRACSAAMAALNHKQTNCAMDSSASLIISNSLAYGLVIVACAQTHGTHDQYIHTCHRHTAAQHGHVRHEGCTHTLPAAWRLLCVAVALVLFDAEPHATCAPVYVYTHQAIITITHQQPAALPGKNKGRTNRTASQPHSKLLLLCMHCGRICEWCRRPLCNMHT